MYIYKTNLTNDVFLKNINNPLVSKYITQINSSCDNFRDQPILSLKFSKFRLFEEKGERAIYQKDYYERRRRMSMFLLRVWLFGEDKDIKELEDILWSVCDEYTWALPAHLPGILTDENSVPNRVDLFAAETAHTIAETLSLCGVHLHPAVVRRCIGEIFKRVIEPFETQDSEKYGLSWEKHHSNWAAVCGGAIGMTALYLIDDELRLNKIITRAKTACNNFFDSCTDDGVCQEGVSYWMYAMQYYVAFDELLKEVKGKSIVNNKEKMKKIAEFPSAVCMANNISVKFSDCNDTNLFLGIFCKLNEHYGVAVPEISYYDNIIDRCARTCGAVRTIAWFNPEIINKASVPKDVFFDDGQWAILHCGDMAVVAKGGNNSEPHNHNDIGSYMYIKGKNIIADELGAAKYSREYFSNNRYMFLNTGSHGHSLPIVNGYRQQNGIEYAADKFEKKEDAIRISFADAYDKNSKIKALDRYLSLDKNGIVVKDRFVFSKKNNFVTERIITKMDAIVTDKNKVLITENDCTLATVEALTGGKINLLKDSYLMPNSTGRNDEYSSEDASQTVTIIEIVCETDSDNLEIIYRIN